MTKRNRWNEEILTGGRYKKDLQNCFFFGWGGIPCRTKGVIIVDENDLTQTEQKTLQKNERGRYIVNQYFYLDQHIWEDFSLS